MLNWRYGRTNCFEARYEDLRQDTQLNHWRRISGFLGFDEREREMACHRFWQNSLFGGLTRFGNKHVRSGDVAQWKREFTKDLGYAFLERYPNTLQSLGYEINNGWVSNLDRAKVPSKFDEMRRLAAINLTLVVGLARYL